MTTDMLYSLKMIQIWEQIGPDAGYSIHEILRFGSLPLCLHEGLEVQANAGRKAQSPSISVCRRKHGTDPFLTEVK